MLRDREGDLSVLSWKLSQVPPITGYMTLPKPFNFSVPPFPDVKMRFVIGPPSEECSETRGGCGNMRTVGRTRPALGMGRVKVW